MVLVMQEFFTNLIYLHPHLYKGMEQRSLDRSGPWTGQVTRQVFASVIGKKMSSNFWSILFHSNRVCLLDLEDTNVGYVPIL